MIRLGVCTGPDKIGQAAELGFEFIECGFAWLSSLTDEEYDKVLAQVQAAPIRVEACNGMLPGDLKVVGDKVDEQAIRAYLEKTFARAQKLGVKVARTSGGSRRMALQKISWPLRRSKEPTVANSGRPRL